MPTAFHSRLTFANVTSVTALVFAMAGGAYALTGIPDRGGVFHGCVDPKTGALRVVKAASACRKTKTVKRGNRRVRIPGESAIAWNQQGQRGLQGIQGTAGSGSPGLPGSPAASAFMARSTSDLSTDIFFSPSGPSTQSATEPPVTMLSPNAAIVARDLAVSEHASSVGDGDRTYILRVAGSDTSLRCVVKLAGKTCGDSSDTVLIPAGSEVSIHLSRGPTGSRTGGAILVGWRATTP